MLCAIHQIARSSRTVDSTSFPHRSHPSAFLLANISRRGKSPINSTIRPLTSSGFRLCSRNGEYTTCRTPAFALLGFPRTPIKQNSVFLIVQNPMPGLSSSLSLGKNENWSTSFLVFNQTNPIVLYSNPHAFITRKHSRRRGHVPHRNSVQSLFATLRTSNAQISSVVIVGYCFAAE